MQAVCSTLKELILFQLLCQKFCKKKYFVKNLVHGLSSRSLRVNAEVYCGDMLPSVGYLIIEHGHWIKL